MASATSLQLYVNIHLPYMMLTTSNLLTHDLNLRCCFVFQAPKKQKNLAAQNFNSFLFFSVTFSSSLKSFQLKISRASAELTVILSIFIVIVPCQHSTGRGLFLFYFCTNPDSSLFCIGIGAKLPFTLWIIETNVLATSLVSCHESSTMCEENRRNSTPAQRFCCASPFVLVPFLCCAPYFSLLFSFTLVDAQISLGMVCSLKSSLSIGLLH